jgi:hypothetical protein
VEYFQIPKNAREVLRVSVREYQGHTFLDLRTFVRQSSGADWTPTRKGATINLNAVEALVEAIECVTGGSGPQLKHIRELAAAALSEHGVPLNWQVLYEMLASRHQDFDCSRWLLYAAMASDPSTFEEISPEVFRRK